MNQMGTIVAVVSSAIVVGAVLYGSRTVEMGAFESTKRFGENYSWLDQQSVLDAVGETSLYDQRSELAEGYRLIWHRSFKPDYVITITKSRNSDFLLCTAGFESRRVLDETQYHGTKGKCRDIGPSSSAEFSNGIEQSGIWQRAPQSKENLGGVDGSTWSIEMLKEGRYHAATRWSPDAESQIHKLGSLIISTAEIEEENDS